MRQVWKVTVLGGIIEKPIVKFFGTKKEAGWYVEREQAAAAELMVGLVSAKIEKARNLSMAGAVWAAELGIGQ